MALTTEDLQAIRGIVKESVDDVLDVMREGFTMVSQKFEGVDHRLDGIDDRLDGIDGRLDGIDHRLDGIDVRLKDMRGDIVGLKEDSALLTHMAKDQSFRLARVERKTGLL